MAPPGDLDALSPTELKAFVVRLLGKVAALEQTVAAQRAEIARLKGLKSRPALKPSGMEKASELKPPSPPKGRRGPVTPRVAIEDESRQNRGVITPPLLLPCGHHSRAGSPDSVDERRPRACRSARLCARRGRAARSLCSSASAAPCSCAWPRSR